MRQSGNSSRRSRGFTLVELMVTVAVLVILVGIAVPSFARLINANRLTAAANELVGALQTARLEAVRRNGRVVLCPTANGASCSTAAGDWGRVLVFLDRNSDNNYTAANDELIKDVEAIKAGVADITPAAVDGVTRIRFGADGRVRIGTGTPPASAGVLAYTSTKLPAASRTRRIEIASSRVSVCTSSGATTACQ